jgi:hypothetical protein
MGGPFTILRFAEPDLPDVVYVEQLTGALYLDKPTEVDSYLEVMEQLCLKAMRKSHGHGQDGLLQPALDGSMAGEVRWHTGNGLAVADTGVIPLYVKDAQDCRGPHRTELRRMLRSARHRAATALTRLPAPNEYLGKCCP